MKRHLRRASSVLSVLAGLGLFASSVRAQDFGYEGPSYTGSSLEPTESKPESKLWFNDGIWWGCLWSVSAQAFHIHRLDQQTHEWTDTGVLIDDRSNSKGDALWTGTKLYVGSHRFSSDGGASGNPILLLRYSYDASTDVYTLDAGFPVTIGTFSTESLVIDRDSTGTVWAAWVQGLRVFINHSVGGNDLVWSGPVILQGSDTNLTDDEVCSLTHFGGNKIGVMWSDQALNLFRFAVHQDGAADNVWTLETPLLGESDDHINLATDAAGRVFATVKNVQNEIKLLVRSSAGVWSPFLVTTGIERFTRPIVLLDEERRVIHVFASGQDNGLIHEKTSSLDIIGFASGTGTVVLRDADNPLVNNATSTKQNVDSTTGLVVLAAHETTGMYWHHSVAPAALLVASFSADPLSGGAPLNVQFTDTSTGDPTQWLWDFGDGATSTQQNPAHAYTTTGAFDVGLTVSDAGGSDLEVWNDLIHVAQPFPVQTFPALADARVNEASPNSNAGTATELRLRFAAGGSYQSYLRFDLSSLTDPIVSAKLRLFCTDGSTVGGTVFPTSNSWTETGITWNNKPAATGAQLDSLGSITTGTWVEYDVTAGIGAPGVKNFLVTTTSSNSALFSSREGANPPELVVQIDASLPPVAEFTASTTSGAAPLSVDFTDLSTGSPNGWSWSFGDGGTSTAQNPTHVYTSAGSYTVSLIVTAPGGSDGASKTDYIVVSGPAAPVAGFTASPTSGTAPLSVAFTDASSGSITSRSWDFGDGGSSTQTSPTHVYTSSGLFTVTLTVTGPGGTDDEIKTDHIAVSGPPAPVAGFSATPTSGTAPLSVTFTDASSGNITSRTWNFGDGGSSTQTSPTHVYTTQGLFTVTLTVNGPGGTDDEIKTDHISVSAPQGGTQTLVPVADARVNQGSPTSNAGTANELRLRFDTGGSYQSYLRFDLSGLSGSVTSAKLRLFCTDGSNQGGAVFPTSNGWTETGITWNNKPAATGAQIGTFGTFVTGAWAELDVTSAIGTLGPTSFLVTNATSNSALFSSREGANPPQLVVQTGAAQPPVANFSATPTSGTAPLTVNFTDTSTGNITSRTWSFGDGGSSTAQNPSHVYTTAGTYDVTLTVSGPGGSDGETKTGFVAVSPPGAPVAGFSASPTSGTAPLSVDFTDASSGNITSRTWDFGDGGSSTATNPTHVYASTGLFTVKLTVSGPGGTDDEIKTDHISVGAPQGGQTLVPVADARVNQGSPTSNSGTANELRLRFDTGGSYQSYLRFDLSGLSGSVTSAKLRLFCTDGSNLGGAVFPTSNGWTETGITWNNKPAATGTQIGTFGTFVTGAWAELDVTAAITGLGPVSFQLTNATSNSALFSSREGANPPQLVVQTGAGQPPVANFSATPTSGTAPLTVQFTDTSTNGPTSWSWSFGDGGTSTAQNPTHVYATTGTFTVGLQATNAQGSSSSVKSNLISVTQAPITTFFPVADARVNEGSPSSNAGTATELRTRFASGGSYHSYLRFDLSGVSASIVSAKLRLFCTDESPQGGLVFPTSSAWVETSITWSNKPAATGAQIAALGAVTNGAWVEVDVTAAIGSPGLESFLLTATTSNSALFSSREGANPPQLVVETAAP